MRDWGIRVCPPLLDELSLLRGQQSDSLHHHHHHFSWCLGDEGDDLIRREGGLREGEGDLLALPSGPSLPTTMLPPLSAGKSASHSVEAVAAAAATTSSAAALQPQPQPYQPPSNPDPNPSQHTNGGMSDEQKEQLQKILDSIELDLSSRDKHHYPDKTDDRDLSSRDKHHHDKSYDSRDKYHHYYHHYDNSHKKKYWSDDRPHHSNSKYWSSKY